MNRENYPQSKEDFDTRLHRAQENNEAQGRVGKPGSSQSGKGLALRIGTELVVAVFVGGMIGFLLDTWLNTKPWLTILFLFLGNAAGLLNIFRLTSNQNYSVGFLQKKCRPENVRNKQRKLDKG